MTLPHAPGSPRAAIDLGTANTRLATLGRGLLVDRPSRVERRAPTEGALALEASPLWPLARGVIVDSEGAGRLIAPLIGLARDAAPAKPWILVCHPSNATEAERALIVETVEHSGAGAVRLVPEPLAAAVGIGLNGDARESHLILDVGDGVSDAAILRSGALSASSALRVGCGDLRALVREAVLVEHGTSLHEEEIHRLLGGLETDAEWIPVERTRGTHRRRAGRRRVVWSGVFVRAAIVRRAVGAFAAQIAGLVTELLRAAGAAPAGVARGAVLWMTGGGALLPELVRDLGARLELEIRTPPDPLHAVIAGAERLLTSFDVGTPLPWASARP